jgi:hypothetical protein
MPRTMTLSQLLFSVARDYTATNPPTHETHGPLNLGPTRWYQMTAAPTVNLGPTFRCTKQQIVGCLIAGVKIWGNNGWGESL